MATNTNTASRPEVDASPDVNGQSMVQHQQRPNIQQELDLQSRLPHYRTYDETGRRAPIREGRIKDRPNYSDAGNSSVRIKIELDLEIEVDLYARVKGDVTIGLM
ncbi:hypothetical protein B7463_g10551, partial [Scytalidium lignicola]